MGGKKIGGIKDPKKDGETANKRYVDKYVDGYVERFKDKNGFFASPWDINMMGKKISGLSLPENLQDAATKNYVDNLIAENVGEGNISGGGSPFFKENSNYQASYAINMGFKKLLNLSTPSNRLRLLQRSTWMKEHI